MSLQVALLMPPRAFIVAFPRRVLYTRERATGADNFIYQSL
jgi:hypothetical protein